MFQFLEHWTFWKERGLFFPFQHEGKQWWNCIIAPSPPPPPNIGWDKDLPATVKLYILSNPEVEKDKLALRRFSKMSETVSFKGFLKGDPDTVEEEVRRFNIDKEVGYDMTIF